jgi:hypothetical protein
MFIEVFPYSAWLHACPSLKVSVISYERILGGFNPFSSNLLNFYYSYIILFKSRLEPYGFVCRRFDTRGKFSSGVCAKANSAGQNWLAKTDSFCDGEHTGMSKYCL